jgi:hypothetical protein
VSVPANSSLAPTEHKRPGAEIEPNALGEHGKAKLPEAFSPLYSYSYHAEPFHDGTSPSPARPCALRRQRPEKRLHTSITKRTPRPAGCFIFLAFLRYLSG